MKFKSIKILIGYALILTLCFFLGSCDSIKKAIDDHRIEKAKTIFDKYQGNAAAYCAVRFPVKDSAGLPILDLDRTRKADNKDYSQLIDSLQNQMDSLSQVWGKEIDSTSEVSVQYRLALQQKQQELDGLKQIIQRLHDQYKPCKPDTSYFTATNWMVDGAAVTDALNKYDQEHQLREKAEQALATTKDKFNWWKIACLITWGILGVISAFWIGWKLK